MRIVSVVSRKVAPWPLAVAALLALSVAACGDSDDPSGDAAPAPTETTAPAPTTPPAPTAAPAATATTMPAPAASPTPAPEPTPAAGPREIGDYEGVTFVVGEGSEATFTVEEQLVRLPAPIDAVMRTTTGLSGEIHLDGRPSTVTIDLQSLSSDAAFRDRYVRERMFGQHRYATFTAGDVGDLPEAFTRGEAASGSGTGQLEIRGLTVPLTLEVEARDDGDVINIVGRTTFTWDDFQIPVPTARSVVSVEDEIRAEILLIVRPK